MAPEILNNLGYGCKVDIFSLGVIMYILLTSKFVFNAKDYNEILRRNKQCKVYFPKRLWENLSSDAQELCALMLKKHPEERISAVDALQHKWFKNHDDEKPADQEQQRNNIFNAQDQVNVNFEEGKDGIPSGDFNAVVDDDKTGAPGLSDNINITDLMTSSPIMNKKKMIQHIAGMGQAQK